MYLFKNKKILLLLDQANVSACNFLIAVLIARFLGASSLGHYASFQIAILFSLSIMGSFLLSPLLAKYNNTEISWKEKYLKGTNSLLLLFCILSCIVIFAIDHFICFFSKAYPLFFIVPYLIVEYFRKVLLLKEKYIEMLFLGGFSYTLSIATVLFSFLFLKDIDIESVVIIQLVVFSVAALTYYIRNDCLQCDFSIWSLKRTMNANFKNGKWLFLSSLTQWFGEPYLLFLSGQVLGPAYLGILRMIQNLVGLLNIIIQIADSYLVIFFSKLDETKINKVIKKYTYITVLMGLLGLLLSIFYGFDVLETVFGDLSEYYDDVIICLPIYILIYFFQFLVIYSRAKFKVIEKTDVIFKATSLAMIITVLLSFILIKTLGIVGVSLGVLINWCAVYFYFLRKG
ncbi:lipopolysaccharide biosynthesis protein [Photobacterium swingsii]|uniref:lipopolysaccharide biosynthesis protein n=1 Tax=Photobacterium swingsii TaxID=680026 RepID=UPI0040686DB1